MDTAFVNGATLTDADWFNDVNRLHYTILADPADVAAVLTVLGVTATSTGTTSSTFTFNSIGGIGAGGTTGSLTLSWQKTGNWVTLNIPAAQAATGTSSTKLTSNTALAAEVRPIAAQTGSVAICDNGGGVSAVGYVLIGTNGVITIYRDATLAAAWANATVCGTNHNASITYFIG